MESIENQDKVVPTFSKDELVMIVDENNQITGSAKRKEVR